MLAGFGKADLENSVVATAKSVYLIGSVTKQFTAAAVMQLVDQGKVKLDDSIATYLSTLPAAWRGATVRQLLNHTSGIPSYTSGGLAWRKRWAEEMTPDTILAMVAAKPVDFAAGTSWRYNNSGYVILGMLVEKIAGRSWADDVEARFAVPLGLKNTRNCASKEVVAFRAHGYDKNQDAWENAPYLAMSQPYAAGAICSNVGDMARWNRALHTGGIVSPRSYTMMTTPEAAATARKYGYGLSRDTLAGREVISHDGDIHGFTSANIWVPSAQLSVTVLTNSSSGNADKLLQQLVRASLGAPLDRPPVVTPLAVRDREKYTGVYSLMLPGGARDLAVTADSAGLGVQLAGQGRNPIIHYGNHTFGARFDQSLRLIFTMAGTRATKVTLVQGGGRFDGLRK